MAVTATNPDELYGKYRKLADPSYKASGGGILGFFSGGEKSADMPEMTFEQAFFVVLLGAAKADGDMRREEEDQIRLVTSRAPTFASMSSAQVADHQLKATQWMFKNGVCEIVGAACETIKKIDANPTMQMAGGVKRGETVFALAVDIAFVDRSFDKTEEHFIAALAKRLGVDEKLRDSVMTVIRIKNAF